MAGWSSLPSGVLRLVGDCLMSTSDIDALVDMRAVCPGWRAAVARPPQLGAGPGELPFRPRQWVMLGEPKRKSCVEELMHKVVDDDDDDDVCLFVNVSTGRILRRRLPCLRHNVLVGASGGLLVLADREHPHAARVLNPFTGSVLTFAAPIPIRSHPIVAVASSEPMVLVLFDARAPLNGNDVMCARPASEEFEAKQLTYGRDRFYIESMVAHAGRVYMVDNDETSIICSRSDGTVQYTYEDLVMKPCHLDGNVFLVESEGELMLVVHCPRRTSMEIFKVDVERRALKPVRSIGSRAFFLGPRCLSVDAEKLCSVDSNCVYYSTREMHFKYGGCMTTGETWTNFDVAPPGFPIWRFDLEEGREEKVSGLLMPEDVCYSVRPFSLLQLLATYSEVLPNVYDQLHRISMRIVCRDVMQWCNTNSIA